MPYNGAPRPQAVRPVACNALIRKEAAKVAWELHSPAPHPQFTAAEDADGERDRIAYPRSWSL